MSLEPRPPIARPDIAAIDLLPRPPVQLVGSAIDRAAMDPRTRRFWEFCRALPRDGGLPMRSSAGPEMLRPWLGNLMILDPIEDGRDFRYRLYGSAIANFCDFDMTGRTVSEFVSKTGGFFLDSYRTCLAAMEPVLTQNVAEHARGMVLWERLLTPFRNGQSGVQIVATNHPIPLMAERPLPQ